VLKRNVCKEGIESPERVRRQEEKSDCKNGRWMRSEEEVISTREQVPFISFCDANQSVSTSKVTALKEKEDRHGNLGCYAAISPY
jgi:hypothetical protein